MTIRTPRAFATAAAALLLVAFLHVAIALGGSSWYAFFGAPRPLVEMAAAGAARAPVTCFIVAALFAAVAGSAMVSSQDSRARPFARGVLAIAGAAFVARGALFVGLAAADPQVLLPFCGRCEALNPFVAVSSAAALAIGALCLAAARNEETRTST